MQIRYKTTFFLTHLQVQEMQVKYFLVLPYSALVTTKDMVLLINQMNWDMNQKRGLERQVLMQVLVLESQLVVL